MTFATFHRGRTARLIRALHRDAGAAGLTLTPVHVVERDWASATFEGKRLTLHLAIAGGDPADWLARLPDADLPVRGALVADLVVEDGHAAGAVLAVLLIDAG